MMRSQPHLLDASGAGLKSYKPLRSIQSGFTLLELLVAMGISMLILTTLAVLFQNSSVNQREIEKVTRMTENARFAMEALSTDLKHAGFMGEVNPQDLTVTFTELEPCATTAAAMGWNLAPLATPATGTLPAAVKGYETTSFGCMSNQRASTPSIGVVHADLGPAVPIASRVAGDLYLSTSRCSTDIAPIELLSSTDVPTLKNLACSATVGLVRRVSQRFYFLSSCSDCSGSGDGIQSLARLERIGGSFRVTTVAENIEAMDIEYGLDTNQDGAVDEYLRSNAINGSPANRNWGNVVTARITLLARTDVPTPGFTDTRSYTVGSITVAGNDYKRLVLTQTIRLTNVAIRQER